MAELTIEHVGRDLELVSEVAADEWGYVLKDGALLAEHYTPTGEIDRRVKLNITFEEVK